MFRNGDGGGSGTVFPGSSGGGSGGSGGVHQRYRQLSSFQSPAPPVSNPSTIPRGNGRRKLPFLPLAAEEETINAAAHAREGENENPASPALADGGGGNDVGAISLSQLSEPSSVSSPTVVASSQVDSPRGSVSSSPFHLPDMFEGGVSRVSLCESLSLLFFLCTFFSSFFLSFFLSFSALCSLYRSALCLICPLPPSLPPPLIPSPPHPSHLATTARVYLSPRADDAAAPAELRVSPGRNAATAEVRLLLSLSLSLSLSLCRGPDLSHSPSSPYPHPPLSPQQLHLCCDEGARRGHCSPPPRRRRRKRRRRRRRTTFPT